MTPIAPPGDRALHDRVAGALQPLHAPEHDIGEEGRTKGGLIVPAEVAEETGGEAFAFMFAPVSIMVKPDAGERFVFVGGVRLLHEGQPPFAVDEAQTGSGATLRLAAADCADRLAMPTTAGQRRDWWKAVERMAKAGLK